MNSLTVDSKSSRVVFVENDEARTSTKIIADGTGNQHKNVIEMVRKYLSDFEQFGRVAFETRKGEPLPQGGFAKATEVAILNEPQATLLVTFMRNSEIVRAFKSRLVREFYEMAEKLRSAHPAIPQTYAQALQLAADQAQQLEHQAQQIEAAKPAVEYHARVAVADDCHPIDEAAKILRVGPRKLRQWMRDNKLLRLDGLPSQEPMNRGYFRVIQRAIELPFGHKLHKQVLVTGKGMQYLQHKIDHHLMGQEV